MEKLRTLLEAGFIDEEEFNTRVEHENQAKRVPSPLPLETESFLLSKEEQTSVNFDFHAKENQDVFVGFQELLPAQQSESVIIHPRPQQRSGHAVTSKKPEEKRRAEGHKNKGSRRQRRKNKKRWGEKKQGYPGEDSDDKRKSHDEVNSFISSWHYEEARVNEALATPSNCGSFYINNYKVSKRVLETRVMPDAEWIEKIRDKWM